MSLTLILPVCGRSERFRKVRPKWLLTHPSGDCMLKAAIRGLDLARVERILIVTLQQHVDEYQFLPALTRQFADPRVEFLVLPQPTFDQPDTVLQAIRDGQVSGSIAIKDCDNYFEQAVEPEVNSVAVFSLTQAGFINPSNKSYVKIDEQFITDIVEKEVVSDKFCCGLYSFSDAAAFVRAVGEARRSNPGAIYISHVIREMLRAGAKFPHHLVSNYLDWGTYEDWQRFKSQFRTLFVDMDGVLVKNASEYMRPRWGETEAIEGNIRYLNELHALGHTFLVVTTSRSDERQVRKELERVGLSYDKILCGLPHCQRMIVNDFSPSNPYQSCTAINLPRDSDTLRDFLR